MRKLSERIGARTCQRHEYKGRRRKESIGSLDDLDVIGM